MKATLLTGGHILNPASGQNGPGDLVMEDGKIKAIFPPGSDFDREGMEVIDCKGLFLAPGFIDLHVHLRVPGDEHKETLATGGKAAAAGGFTTLVSMPNTRPRLCRPDQIRHLLDRAREEMDVRLLPAAAMIDEEGNLTDYSALVDAGAICLSDDAFPVQESDKMWEGMKGAGRKEIPLFTHPEDQLLSKEGIIHAGEVAEKLGVDGIPPEAEELQIARNILFAEGPRTRLHIQHLSTARGLSLLRWGKSRQVRVTAEVCPHHLFFTHRELEKRDANYRMNPPLRTEEDRLALIEGLKDRSIDAIATDHAPHSLDEKRDFLQAPFGVIGMETAFPVVWTLLRKELRPLRIIELLTKAPAEILDLPLGDLSPGKSADVVALDLNETWTMTEDMLQSKSKNCPYLGQEWQGKVMMTFAQGRLIYQNKG